MTNHEHSCRLCGKPTNSRLVCTRDYRCEEHEDTDILRVVRFHPYLKGKGPAFSLITWDCYRYYRNGPQWQIGYRLTMRENGKSTTLFYGEDYGCSPMHAIDSDACVRGIMAFLTLRPGDTDREYFDNYTPAQLAYCDQHAESLEMSVCDRFGED